MEERHDDLLMQRMPSEEDEQDFEEVDELIDPKSPEELDILGLLLLTCPSLGLQVYWFLLQSSGTVRKMQAVLPHAQLCTDQMRNKTKTALPTLAWFGWRQHLDHLGAGAHIRRLCAAHSRQSERRDPPPAVPPQAVYDGRLAARHAVDPRHGLRPRAHPRPARHPVAAARPGRGLPGRHPAGPQRILGRRAGDRRGQLPAEPAVCRRGLVDAVERAGLGNALDRGLRRRRSSSRHRPCGDVPHPRMRRCRVLRRHGWPGLLVRPARSHAAFPLPGVVWVEKGSEPVCTGRAGAAVASLAAADE